ncbi:MAG: hypothetical protein ACD_4C00138G0022 [uncultured bacterium (gcode 4)]|uniref:Uncharacterized protein n=1 Tax=uncultured bacterium (gcode 4) TaxID=1234023 RepID=K2FV47_9BACT|nr:MAG: hypothetical protein ACD_4C00138G0022 [uncultured bacterium (gcode 4)]
MKKIVMISLLVIGSFILINCNQQWNNPTNEGWTTWTINNTWENIWTPSQEEDKTEWYTIEITKDWFNPSSLTINVWDKVNFINKDTNPHWPASAMHPTHEVYPWSSIEKCWTDEKNTIFDACKWLAEWEIFSFTFNEKWTWRYHDHLDPSKFWSIIVN